MPSTTYHTCILLNAVHTDSEFNVTNRKCVVALLGHASSHLSSTGDSCAWPTHAINKLDQYGLVCDALRRSLLITGLFSTISLLIQRIVVFVIAPDNN